MNINTKKRLAFSLLAKDNGSDDTTMWNVHPSYSGVSLKWDKESGERYYTQSIDGTFTFNGSEAGIITGRTIYTQFTLVIFDLDNGGNEVSRGTFRLTDCEIDIDHSSVKVKITTNKPYKKLVNKKDDEYNVVDLGLNKRTVKLWNYPNYQTYILGDKRIVISTRNGSNAFDCEQQDNLGYGALGYQSMFDRFNYGWAILVRYNSSTQSFENVFFKSTNYTPVDVSLTIRNVGKLVCDDYPSDYILVQYGSRIGTTNYDKFRLLVNFPDGGWPQTELFTEWLPISSYMSHSQLMFYSIAQNEQIVERFRGTVMLYGVEGRIVTNVKLDDVYDAENVKTQGLLSVDDFYRSNKRYAKQRTPNYSWLAISTNVSPTDTGYGKVPNTDTWYDSPDHTNNWIALYQESWYQGISFWMRDDVTVSNADIEEYKNMEEVQDFYSLGDVIKAVLGKIDENILFEPDATHSRFLFDTINPVTQQQQGELLISQKSNILNLQYDYPAWKAPVKMSQILTFLRYAFNCYYHIDENNHFHIEHVLYYMNGGSYSTEQRGTVDLTMWRDCGNKQKLSFLTNRWSYETDSSNQASRIEFGWMDSQSELFNGWPIIVPTAYLIYTDERKDERRVDWFSTDIDFLTSVPAECSSDGFAVVRLSLTDAGFVEEGQYTLNGVTYTTQNVSLSFPVLHQNFMLYDLWSEYVTINNSETLVAVRKRSPVRTAEVGFIKPNTMAVDNPNIIVKTDAGNGEVESMSVDLTDMKVTTTLKYEI